MQNTSNYIILDHLHLFSINQGHKIVDKVAVVKTKRQRGASCYQQYQFLY